MKKLVTDDSSKAHALRILAQVTKGSFFAIGLGALAIATGNHLSPAEALIPQGILLGGIGVILDRILDPHESVTLAEINQVVEESGIKNVVSTSERNQELLEKLIAQLGVPAWLSAGSTEALIEYLNQPKPFPESREFSPQIRDRLKLANKTIEELTKNQYIILNQHWAWNQVAISGCAGSGKTLMAAEQAQRLAKEQTGFRILFLCHNPDLATFIETLVVGTGAKVVDFTSWVNELTGRPAAYRKGWTHYVEPTDSELEDAHLMIWESPERYDAILVDEGQDFRAEWWELIVDALRDRDESILWIYHDDNQALLPRNMRYPVPGHPITLSTNLRNAGQIFDLVRIFHSQSPISDKHLIGQGIVRRNIFSTKAEIQQLFADAVNAMKREGLTDIVVLTTEPEPITRSVLNDLEIELVPLWRWQDSVQDILGPMDLSEDLIPNQDDIRTVTEAAIKMIRKDWRPAVSARKFKWYVDKDKLLLSQSDHYDQGKYFFLNDDWADGIPRPEKLRLATDSEADVSALPLRSVSSFKGLEADNVIVFIPASFTGDRAHLESMLYVALSRARFMLHILIDRSIAAKFPQIISGTQE